MIPMDLEDIEMVDGIGLEHHLEMKVKLQLGDINIQVYFWEVYYWF